MSRAVRKVPPFLAILLSPTAAGRCSASNAIVTGFLNNGGADFGGSLNGTIVSGLNDADSFIAKYNPSGGVQWVQTGYGGYDIVADTQNNLYSNDFAKF